MHKLECVQENETHEILEDFEMQTDHQIPTRGLDQVKLKKREREREREERERERERERKHKQSYIDSLLLCFLPRIQSLFLLPAQYIILTWTHTPSSSHT